MYVYAFPVQQVISQVVTPHSGWILSLLAMPITFGLAVLSWHFVERPALDLKTRVTGGERPAGEADAAGAVAGRAAPRSESGWVRRLGYVPSFKAAYLIHGDDHGRIAERRANLRTMAEAESGAQGLELFEGDAATPEAVAAALNAMTFALGGGSSSSTASSAGRSRSSSR